MDPKMASGHLVRAIDDEWSEYLTASGRKFYRNDATDESTWKPPRKTKTKKENRQSKPPIEEIHPNASSWSLPTSPEDNVGGILRRGSLRITKAYFNESSKSDWHKCIAYLTSTHFVYRRKKKLDEHAGKISLSLATIQLRHGKSKQYVLNSMRNAIFFKSKKDVEAEAWFHAIAAVIHTLCRPKTQRPWSFIEFGSAGFPAVDSMFIADFDSISPYSQQKTTHSDYSEFERKILDELLQRNSLGEEKKNVRGLKALFGRSENKVWFSDSADPLLSIRSNETSECPLNSTAKEAMSSKESLLSLSVIEETDEEPVYSEIGDRVSENGRMSAVSGESDSASCEHCKMLQMAAGVNFVTRPRMEIKADIKRGENEKTADEDDSGGRVLLTNKGNPGKIVSHGGEMLSIEKSAIDRQETNQPNTRSQPEIEPGDVVKNENAGPSRFKLTILPPKFKYPTPPGWVARFDERTEQYLYENVENLDVWAAAETSLTNRDSFVFFYNTESYQTSLLLPSIGKSTSSSRKETSV